MANSALGGGCDNNCGACAQAASCGSKAKAGQLTGPQLDPSEQNQGVAISSVGKQEEQLFSSGQGGQMMNLQNKVRLN